MQWSKHFLFGCQAWSSFFSWNPNASTGNLALGWQDEHQNWNFLECYGMSEWTYCDAPSNKILCHQNSLMFTLFQCNIPDSDFEWLLSLDTVKIPFQVFLYVIQDVEKGQVHTDMYILSLEDKRSTESVPLKWKWQVTKPSGDRPSARSGASSVQVCGLDNIRIRTSMKSYMAWSLKVPLIKLPS